MTVITESEWLSLTEAGRRLGVSRSTIKARILAGLLPAYRTGPRAHPKVRAADVDALLTPVPVAAPP